MTRPVHPETGLHYIAIIPDDHGAYTDIRACYEVTARRVPWLTVHGPHFNRDEDGPLHDETVFFLCWMPLDPPPPMASHRKATFALVYSEAMDDDLTVLLPAHRDHFVKTLTDMAQGRWDGLFVHTPWMMRTLQTHIDRSIVTLPESHWHGRVAVLPVGWEPEAMGYPRTTRAVRGLCYHGSLAGRRQLLVPFLQAGLGDLFYDASGAFGRALIGALDSSMASLYIAHSGVQSFSTWRLWQCLAAGRALLAEPGDSWPFVAGEDYIPIGPLTLDNADTLALEMRRLVTGGAAELQTVARRAFDQRAHFTTKHCIDTYLVPASVAMARR